MAAQAEAQHHSTSTDQAAPGTTRPVHASSIVRFGVRRVQMCPPRLRRRLLLLPVSPCLNGDQHQGRQADDQGEGDPHVGRCKEAGQHLFNR